MKAYFISDAHLSCDKTAEEARKQEMLHRFFQMIEDDASHLFIVGDLFDFWFEYKYVISKGNFDFLYEMKRLSEKGIKIHYLAGNHDFALGSFFPNILKINVWPEEYAFELNGKKFFLFHGDGVAKRDVGYKILRRILRNKFNQKIFCWIHPDIGYPLARFVSGSSRKYTNQKNDKRDESDYIEFAENKFKQGYDFVMMGHRHNPLVHENGSHRYINLGDWMSKFTYALFDGKKLTLNKFE